MTNKPLRVLFIDPPYDRMIGHRATFYPTALGFLASYIVDKGYKDVAIYHGDHQPTDGAYQSHVQYAKSFNRYKDIIEAENDPIWDEVRKIVTDFRPDVIGLTVLTPKVPSALRVAKICKEVNPNVRIVSGGSHASKMFAELLANENIEFAVRGEGEETFYELLEAFRTNNTDYAKIDGLVFVDDNGEVVVNQHRAPIKDLDSLPWPAVDKLIDIENFTPTELSMVMTTRGCPFDCGFCASQATWGRTVRYRSPQDVIDEIKHMKEEYGVKHVNFMDDSFTIATHHVRNISEAMLENNLNITWNCLTRVDLLTEDLLRLMKRAGCIQVDVGIESGNDRVLKLIDKRITTHQVREAGKMFHKTGIYWSAFFMVGFPTETEEEMLDTINFIGDVKPNWANMSIFTPYPATKLYYLAKEKGLVSDPVDYTMYGHQNPQRFTDVVGPERFSEIATLALETVYKHNTSFRSLLRRAMIKHYHRNPKLLINDARHLLNWLFPAVS